MRLADEVLQHLLGDGEIRDDAVFQRANGRDVAGRSAEHVLRFVAHGFDDAAAAPRVFPNGDDRRLVEHDAVPA